MGRKTRDKPKLCTYNHQNGAVNSMFSEHAINKVFKRHGNVLNIFVMNLSTYHYVQVVNMVIKGDLPSCKFAVMMRICADGLVHMHIIDANKVSIFDFDQPETHWQYTQRGNPESIVRSALKTKTLLEQLVSKYNNVFRETPINGFLPSVCDVVSSALVTIQKDENNASCDSIWNSLNKFKALKISEHIVANIE